MSKVRSRLPPSFSVTVGTYPIAPELYEIYSVGWRDSTGPGGLLRRAAQGGEGEAAGAPANVQQRARARPPHEAAFRPSGVSLRGLAPHRGRPAGDRSPPGGLA